MECFVILYVTFGGEGGNGWGVRYSSPSHVMRLRHLAYIVNVYISKATHLQLFYLFIYF